MKSSLFRSITTTQHRQSICCCCWFLLCLTNGGATITTTSRRHIIFLAQTNKNETFANCGDDQDIINNNNNNNSSVIKNCTIVDLQVFVLESYPKPYLSISRREDPIEEIVPLDTTKHPNELRFTLDPKFCYRFALLGEVNNFLGGVPFLMVQVDGVEMEPSQIQPLKEYFINSYEWIKGYIWDIGACSCLNNNDTDNDDLALFEIALIGDEQNTLSTGIDWYVEQVTTTTNNNSNSNNNSQVVLRCKDNTRNGICTIPGWSVYRKQQCLPQTNNNNEKICYRLVTSANHEFTTIRASFHNQVFHARKRIMNYKNSSETSVIYFGNNCPEATQGLVSLVEVVWQDQDHLNNPSNAVLTFSRRDDNGSENVVKLLDPENNGPYQYQFQLELTTFCYMFAIMTTTTANPWIGGEPILSIHINGQEYLPPPSQIKPWPSDQSINGENNVVVYVWHVGACACNNNNTDDDGEVLLELILYQDKQPSVMDWFVEEVTTGQIVWSCGDDTTRNGVCDFNEWYLYHKQQCLPENACYRLVSFSDLDGITSVQASFGDNFTTFYDDSPILATGKSITFGNACPNHQINNNNVSLVEIFSTSLNASTTSIPVHYRLLSHPQLIHMEPRLTQRYNNSLFHYASFIVPMGSCVIIDPIIHLEVNDNNNNNNNCQIRLDSVVYKDQPTTGCSNEPIVVGHNCNAVCGEGVMVEIKMSFNELWDSPDTTMSLLYWKVQSNVMEDKDYEYSSWDLFGSGFRAFTDYVALFCLHRDNRCTALYFDSPEYRYGTPVHMWITWDVVPYSVQVDNRYREKSPYCIKPRGDTCNDGMIQLFDDDDHSKNSDVVYCPFFSFSGTGGSSGAGGEAPPAEADRRRGRAAWVMVPVGLCAGFGIGILFQMIWGRYHRCCCCYWVQPQPTISNPNNNTEPIAAVELVSQRRS